MLPAIPQDLIQAHPGQSVWEYYAHSLSLSGRAKFREGIISTIERMTEIKDTQPGTSDVTTEGIRIRVGAQRVKNHNFPDPDKNIFIYQVVIENCGDDWVQLLSRRWRIVDGDGHEEIIQGPGVVGLTPELEPGQAHKYQSFCPLDTAWGSMEGHFTFRRRDESLFQAEVGRFFLASSERP